MSATTKTAIALWLLIPWVTLIVAYHSQVHSEGGPRQAVPPSPSPHDVAKLCEDLKQIEVTPFKGEPVADPAYNALLTAGEDAIPCLIRKITDETRMKDPRQVPNYGTLAVGDTAFFVFTHIAKIDQPTYVQLLPPEVRKAYEGGQGMDGYFRYIDENNNRKKLQDAAVKWYEKKYGRSLP
ncbi:MAG TPA: hypothetical protein VHQ94_24060 [Pyrinomonadaceae bacterium]|nr:hypothetical protein [Pyrinomonadaceae bacterium]